MKHRGRARSINAAALALSLAGGCASRVGPGSEGPACADAAAPGSSVQPIETTSVDAVDILFEVDDSNSMRDNQAGLGRAFGALIEALLDPPADPTTMLPRHAPVRSLHVGVISSDLGTPGSVVPSCANSDAGDDGVLNPPSDRLRSRHWTPPTGRPPHCPADPRHFPSFLAFDARFGDRSRLLDDFVCYASLGTGGCGLEQQLESAYRALVVRNPRALAGNTDPNAGFVRPGAALAIVILSDEDDTSVRDCRHAEPGDPDGDCRPPRGDAVSVFDSESTRWASRDLNLRGYLYRPGSEQDPTWNLNRYLDPSRPDRGFTSLKPGRPDLVVFAAITGVPIVSPTRAGTRDTDWNALLGRSPDGSDGYSGMSPEGPVSMRQGDPDPRCPTRVVPACRREGSSYNPAACDTAAQYFAWPARRITQVARRFAERYEAGLVASICRNDYSDALRQVADLARRRVSGRCLDRPLETFPPVCDNFGRPAGCLNPGGDSRPVRVNCAVRETLPLGLSTERGCTSERGRRPAGRDPSGRAQCLVEQVPAPRGARPASGTGFYYDTSVDPGAPGCRQRISFTPGAGIVDGATAVLECPPAPAPGGGC